jgi:hypothetical protein
LAPPHPSEQGSLSYCGPVRRRAPHRYSVPSVSASARSLSRPQRLRPPVDVSTPALLTFRARAADQAHAASTPDTAWPIHGHPPDSSRRAVRTPDFDVISLLRRFNSDVRPGHPDHTSLGRLPGPYLTRSSRTFSLSLTTTVFSQRSTGRTNGRGATLDATLAGRYPVQELFRTAKGTCARTA